MEKVLKKTAADIMTKKVVTVQQEDTLKSVFKLMDEKGVYGVPVVDDKNHVVGIVTETDLIEHFTTLETPKSVNLLGAIIYLDDTESYNQHLKDHAAEMVKDMMTTPVITVKESTSFQEVIDIMSEKRKIRLPVLDSKHQLVGIITRSDVVHQLAKIKNI